jgi:hypothetical protein
MTRGCKEFADTAYRCGENESNVSTGERGVLDKENSEWAFCSRTPYWCKGIGYPFHDRNEDEPRGSTKVIAASGTNISLGNRRDPFLEKTKSAFCVWLEDKTQKGLSVQQSLYPFEEICIKKRIFFTLSLATIMYKFYNFTYVYFNRLA